MRKIKVHGLGPVDENVFSVQQVDAFYSFAGAKYAEATVNIVFGLENKENYKMWFYEKVILCLYTVSVHPGKCKQTGVSGQSFDT